MADKKLCEQNLRWLRDMRAAIAEAQECAVNLSVDCTRDEPEVSWGVLGKKIERMASLVRYAQDDAARRSKAASAA